MGSKTIPKGWHAIKECSNMKVKNGIYKGEVTAFSVKQCKTKDGREFQRFITEIAISTGDNNIAKLKCSSSMEHMKKLCTESGCKSSELVGRNVECKVTNRDFKSTDGRIGTVSEVAYFGIQMEDGSYYYGSKPKEKAVELDF